MSIGEVHVSRRGILVLCIAALVLVFSPSVALAARGTKLTVSASAATATVQAKVTLTGRLLTSSGHGIRGVRIRLERYVGGAWQDVKQVSTNSSGRATVVVQPASDTEYRYRFLGSGAYRKSSSAARTVGGYAVPDQQWSGSGTQVVGPFALRAGLAVFDATCSATESNYIVWLKDSGGNDVNLIANYFAYPAAAYSGSVACNVPRTGTYYLDIECDTAWTIVGHEPRTLTAPATRSWSGAGPTASGLFTLPKGACKFQWSHTGESNFIVDILDRNGNYVDNIANEIGTTSGSSLVAVPATGQYVLSIDADGTWGITGTPQ